MVAYPEALLSTYYVQGSGQWREGYRVDGPWPTPSRSSRPSMAVSVHESLV